MAGTFAADSHLFPLTLESFSGLEHEARLRAFSRMLDLCSHHDHVALREELEARLARDFLTLLPPEIAVMILSYLPLKDLITGMHVCRRWREIIGGANPLWKNVTNEIGLSEAIVKAYLPECGSYKELTLRALRHRKCISSYVPDLVRAEELGYSVFFASVEDYVIYYGDSVSSAMKVKRMCNDGTLNTLHAFNCSDIELNLDVQIGPFANRNFLFWGSYGTGWIGWSSTDLQSSLHPPPSKKPKTDHVSDTVETDTGLHVWRTNEIEHCWPENLAVCPNCGLIAIFWQDVGVPSVLFRKLTPGKSTVDEIRRCTLPLKIPRIVSLENSGIDMMMIPKQCKQGVCDCHYLLVNYEPDNLLSLHSVPADLSCISELPTVRLPIEFENWTGDLWSGMCVCSSTDGSVVSFLGPNNKQYHVWEPESGRVVSIPFPPNLDCHFWLATGKLYSILGGSRVFAVIGTYTGEILLEGVYDDPDIFPPGDQSWLSSFDSPENLPIAIQYRTFQAGASIRAIIAQRKD